VLKKDLSSIFKAKKIRTLILRTDPGEEESSCQKSPLEILFSNTQSVGVSPQITVLENLKISNLPNLISLPEGIGNFTALQKLEIYNLPCLISLPEGIGNFTALQKLEISNLPFRFCPNLTSLPSGMHRLSSLQTLIIIRCPHLKERYQKGIGEIAHVPDFQYRD
ncbi:putative disease resistance protein rga4, partial [Quercus suber]